LPSEAEILKYLVQHPGAKDTLEGVVEWWMLDFRLGSTAKEVKAGLEQLMAQNLVIAERGGDGRIYYRANPASRP
jgi:hypothetical protein